MESAIRPHAFLKGKIYKTSVHISTEIDSAGHLGSTVNRTKYLTVTATGKYQTKFKVIGAGASDPVSFAGCGQGD